MAAQIIANELKMDLYRFDLSWISSKKNNEVEKILKIYSHEAASSNSILFFEKAESTFKTNTISADSGNWNASNLYVSFLLRKIEEHEGVTLLSVNSLNDISEDV